MELLIILLFVLFMSRIVASMSRGVDKGALVEALKTCPPHKWEYDEIKDTEGTTVKWRLVCKVCGPLKPIETPDRNSM